MKLFSTSSLVLIAVTSVTVAFAQDNANVAPASAPAPAALAKPTRAAPAPVTIDSYVYVDVMPTPTQLTTEAEREGLVIKRIEKSADRTVVVYQYPDTRTRAFAYTLTSPEDATDAPERPVTLPTTPAPRVVYAEPAPAPTTTVIYREPERVYIYDQPRYRYYEPVNDFWAPLAVGIGLGWGFGHSHGGYHGHGGWRR